MNYFMIRNYYERGFSGHMIRARNKRQALQITEKHGIANPFNNHVRKRTARKLLKRRRFDRLRIEMRRQGKGGSIYYEDKDGKLQIET